MPQTSQLEILKSKLSGELHYDALLTSIYATDASVYRQLPTAVAFPKTKEDIKHLIQFAKTQKTSPYHMMNPTHIPNTSQCAYEYMIDVPFSCAQHGPSI